MQLRFLKARSRLKVWPPSDGGRYGLRDSPQLQESGVLTATARIGNRLSVTIQLEGRQHTLILDEWPEPPSIEEVHAALRTMLGKRIWEVGQVDIAKARQQDEAGY